ncbi:MAG: peptidylprolyl isomerase [Planctomycetota bacterium]
MKNLMLIAGMLAVIILANGCSKGEKTAADDTAAAPEAQVEPVEATVEEPAKEAVVQEEKPAVVLEEPAVEQESPATAEEVVDAIDPDAVVVTVNGQAIIEKQVSEETAKRLEAQKKRMPAGATFPDTMKQQVRNRVIDGEVEQALLSQEMAKQNISVPDDQVLEELKKIAGQRDQSIEDVEEEVAKMGMTLEDIKGQIRSQMQVKLLMETLNPDAVVTDADVQKFYDDNPQYFEQKEQIRASHILCGKRGIKEDEYPAELEKIEAAKARLDAGEAFEDVAKDVSTCPSKDKGGDLGFFGKGQMDPAFEKAAFETEPGQTTGIVKTSFGYHIIKVTDKKEAGTTSFEEAKEKITQFLSQQKQREFWTGYQKTMRDNAVIEYSEKEQALRDEMEKAAAAAAAARAAQQAAPRPIQPVPAPKPEPAEATEEK